MSPNGGGGGCEVSANKYIHLYTGAQKSFRDLTPYLTYVFIRQLVMQAEKEENPPIIVSDLNIFQNKVVFELVSH